MRKEFSKRTKRDAFARAKGHCEKCSAKLWSGNVEYDHEIECARGGTNDLENCVVLCLTCHKEKTKQNAPVLAKTRRQSDMAKGIKKPSRWPNQHLKKKLDGTVVHRDTEEPIS